jgi:hypothetical protein
MYYDIIDKQCPSVMTSTGVLPSRRGGGFMQQLNMKFEQAIEIGYVIAITLK